MNTFAQSTIYVDVEARTASVDPVTVLARNISSPTTMTTLDFIERGQAKVWPLFTFVEPPSTNVAKPSAGRRGAPWR